jgi:hypothetical protein
VNDLADSFVGKGDRKFHKFVPDTADAPGRIVVFEENDKFPEFS